MIEGHFPCSVHLQNMGSQVAADGGCQRNVVHTVNEGYRVWGALNSMQSNRGLGIKANKCLYEGVIIIGPCNCVVRSRGMGFEKC